ncbi:unnamed protein product [Medioppia subpectinata]|uniref:Elongation of very long chain fatty acids protein n=1 Tax=Medioppia subpectinata TaxID=1979941 RepID=A0A7R9PW05_9ACAR|nr:unnamed protein product [Medioppia subpectinata]CAG2103209.1 unnamed protein product [Medioppia subpectinata]
MSSSISFDEILMKKFVENTPQTQSLLSRWANGLSLNDSDVWHNYPGLPFALNIEANTIGDTHRLWIGENWHFTIWVSIVYMVVIFLGAQYMKTRPAFNLRRALAIWSASLAVFSIIGTIRCVPEFIDILYNRGFLESFCNNSYKDDSRLVFWYLVFIWSKVAELGDTAFIVLRKQKLINLHWIHHVLTLCYCFFVFPDEPGTARWMVGMNYTIHSLMYTYYSLRALRIRIPRGISMTITIAQIVQMIFGLIINIISFKYVAEGTHCDMTVPTATTGLALYTLFFILFINFFIYSYFVSPKTKRIVFINDKNHNEITTLKKFE